MYLAREHTQETLPAIGARFGGRNHTTVLHACRRTAERLAGDPEAVETVRHLTDRLTAMDPTGAADRLHTSPPHPMCARSPELAALARRTAHIDTPYDSDLL